MPIDLTTTNLWLAVLAIAVALQTTLIMVAAFWAYRTTVRVNVALDRAERALVPLTSRAASCLDDFHAISASAQRAEATIRETTDSVRHATERLGNGAQVAKALVLNRLWPVTGVIRGLGAAAAVFGAARSRRQARRQEDEDAEARFLYEGGATPVRPSR